jgi:predicted ATPase
MQLKKFQYCEYSERPNEWHLDSLTLGRVNLIVGKNSSGKSRALSTIIALSRIVSNRIKPSLASGSWDCAFEDQQDTYEYKLELKEMRVVKEVFTKNNKKLLDRGEDGSGFIWSTREDHNIEFQTPTSDVAVVNRRDSKQHPFFDKLHDWGASVFSYSFGTFLGKQNYGIPVNAQIEVDLYNQDMVLAIFQKGKREFPLTYVEEIKSDMLKLGYSLENIDVSQPSQLAMMPVGLLGITVQESDLTCATEQASISQGMFRALSVLIQFNYAKMASKADCVIVDDIGEGLDFERSCDLIDLLVKKSGTSNVQLILSTNDRFVMNKVPLQSWTLLKRSKTHVSVFNYVNSQKYFDEFKFTGMNNFDFFATDFVSENLEDSHGQEGLHEEASDIR